MKKNTLIAFSLFLFLLAQNSFASERCYKRLTRNFSKDSTAHHVKADFDEGTKTEDYARIMVERALKKLKCSLEDIEIEKIQCNEIVPESSITEVCFVKAKMGYFFVVKDMVDSGNVIFNRWD